MKKEKIIDTVTDLGGSIAGSVTGTVIGTVIAGPTGAVSGALIGTAIEKTFVAIGNDIKERYLSKNERKKIGEVCELAKEKIAYKIENGHSLRTDSFFDMIDGNRSAAEEALEGTLFAAQKEYEERKLPFLANLYANLNFDETASQSISNFLIKIASNLSYRQIVILSIIGKIDNNVLDLPLRFIEYRGFTNDEDISIAAEIYDLYRTSLLISNTAMLDHLNFIPNELILTGMGELLYQYMELENLESDDIEEKIIRFLTDNSPPLATENFVGGHAPKKISRKEVDNLNDENDRTWKK